MVQLVDGQACSDNPKKAATHRLRLMTANDPMALLRICATQCDHCLPRQTRPRIMRVMRTSAGWRQTFLRAEYMKLKSWDPERLCPACLQVESRGSRSNAWSLLSNTKSM